MKVKSEREVAQLHATLRDPMDCSPPGSSIHGIFRARVLEWGAIAFSGICPYIYLNRLLLFRCFRRVQLFVTPWTVAHQAPLSMGFSRQEYWSGQPFPSLGALPDPGIEPWSPALQVDFLLSEPRGKPNLKANTNASLLVEKQTSLVTKFLCVKN